jgi:outer membrane protein OmpA-like peptidoglycan-associated protein
MKYLKSYNNYEPLNEGWKENLLAGLLTLVGSYAYGQQQDPSKIVRKAKTEKQVQNLIDLGYTLDSTSVDTVWKELVTKAPDSEVISIRYTLDKDQYFESGKFTLNDNMKLGIDSIIKEIIEDGGIITNVDIESSTDKQPVGKELQAKLKSLGYEPDNNGLSKARCESIKNYLLKNKIDSTLISTTEKVEMGEGEIDQSARVVNVDFYYVIPSAVLPYEDEKEVDKLKVTYYLSKEKEPVKIVKIKHKGIKVKKMGTVRKTGSTPPLKCWN